ncbi:MAG: GxxExxY protein [Prevotella sp.]|nr:GxxExxY protein [Prevotella sp.]
MDMYEVVGVAMEVYNILGRGMSEPIYQECMAKEFKNRGMVVEKEKPLYTYYKGEQLDKVYYADFFFKNIVIELKSVDEVNSDHRAQLFNYMRITKQHRGILFNFGETSLHTERYLYLSDYDQFVLLNQDNYRDYIT